MLFWLLVFVFLAAASFAGWWGYRVYVLGDASLKLPWFAPRPEPRLSISEQATVDSRRRLVLVRRDDVEHLIMTGGPVDVVIETGISAPHAERVAAGSLEASPPAFSRQPRAFGQAVNE